MGMMVFSGTVCKDNLLNSHRASFRRQISMKCLISETSDGIVDDVEEFRGEG